MNRRRLATTAVMAVSLNLAAAGLGLAQPAPDALGQQVAHEMLAAVDMVDLVKQGAVHNAAAFDAFGKVRPEWKALMLEAIDEAVTQDTPEIEALLGRALARSMTADELNAGLIFFRDPQARAAIAAASRHQPVASAGSCSPECMRAMNSPAGRGFMQKMGVALGPQAQADMIALVVPDMLIRFGEKAKAAEARRVAP